MDELDARSLLEETLEVLRRQAHRLRCEEHTWSEIASIVGVHLSTYVFTGYDQAQDRPSRKR